MRQVQGNVGGPEMGTALTQSGEREVVMKELRLVPHYLQVLHPDSNK